MTNNGSTELDNSAIAMGFFITVVLHIVLGGIAFMIAGFTNSLTAIVYTVAGFPLIQSLWVLPLFLVQYRKGAKRFSKGVLICATLPILMWGACWGVFSLK